MFEYIDYLISFTLYTMYPFNFFFFFFFNDTATTEIYTLSLHDALPISNRIRNWVSADTIQDSGCTFRAFRRECLRRSEEHTSELQSQSNLVCRLLLEKKKKKESQNTCNREIHNTYLGDVMQI